MRRPSPPMPILCASLAICATLVLTACHADKETAAPPALVVALPITANATAAEAAAMRYPVQVAARYSNPLSFRVSGKLVERKVRLGDSVRKGEVLARLDPIDAQKQADVAEAALAAARAQLVFERQQLARDRAQAAKNLIATNQLEQTQDAFAAALTAQEQAAAQLVIARDNLRYNTLVAEHDGVITSENADTGQVVTAGQEIYGLAWSGSVDVNLDAAASDLGRIALGESAIVTFPALPDRSFLARVREIAPQADPQSRTYRIKLTLANPGQSVRLGMTGTAVLSPMPNANQAGPQDPAFTVPTSAIFHRGDSPAVWVVAARSSTLELRPVTVRSFSDHSAIVAGNLKNGDTVVLAGVHTVYAGEHVTAVRPLFDGEGDVAGPAPYGSAEGHGVYASGGRRPGMQR